MFRRLFAIETAALQTDIDNQALRQDQGGQIMGNGLRDMSRSAATPSCYGMWASRAAY